MYNSDLFSLNILFAHGVEYVYVTCTNLNTHTHAHTHAHKTDNSKDNAVHAHAPLLRASGNSAESMSVQTKADILKSPFIECSYDEYARALTFENVCQGGARRETPC